jgi:hypothetical protein
MAEVRVEPYRILATQRVLKTSFLEVVVPRTLRDKVKLSLT